MNLLRRIFGCQHRRAGGTIFRDAKTGDLYRVCECSARVKVDAELPTGPPRFRSVLLRRDDAPKVPTALERIADEEMAREWGVRMDRDG